jgi:excisionase family DNA binding protein
VRPHGVLKNWIDGGTLPALRIGRRVRVRREDFDALLERGRTTPPPPAATSQAQAFREGELHPTPVAALGDDG